MPIIYDYMTIRAHVTEVVRGFSDYINRVAYNGERFLLIRGGKAVAELSPVPPHTRLAELPAILESLPRLGEAEAQSFEQDLERARSEATALPPDPWAP
jgi:antitoxin (DNA-binding transcriptional repressor) of toxin-antitoxin stability system